MTFWWVNHKQAFAQEFTGGFIWSPELSASISPRKFIAEIAPLLPARNSPIRENGKGNQACYLAAISQDLLKVLLGISSRNNLLPAHLSGAR